MKRILFFIITALSIAACSKMTDNIDKYTAEERIYPGKYEIASVRIGYERVEIDLIRAGRVPSSMIHLGSAISTVVEYDNKILYIDSLCSWVNITGLTEEKNYHFKIYTLDKYGNKSVPQEVSATPFLDVDLNSISLPSPTLKYSTESETSPIYDAHVSWPSGLNSSMLFFIGLDYSFSDKDGKLYEGEQTGAVTFDAPNLLKEEATFVTLTARVVPIITNVAIRDTLEIVRTLRLDYPRIINN